MADVNLAFIKQKSLRGVVALTTRTFFLQIIAFGATFLLTVFLTPAIFGVFYVVSAVISFLNYFSDIGLAAALIQKKDELTVDDLKTTFTIQQLLVVAATVFAYLLTGFVTDFYHLDSAGVGLFHALIFSFFISSLKTIPSVLLERKLDFQSLVIPQILETIGFYGVAVVLASMGLGISSFTWAVIVRSIVGLIALYLISPWRIQIGISRPVAKRLLKFGIPFQMNSFLALVKDDLLIVYLGKVLPFAEVGYIGWAKKWAEVPLRLIMDSVIRVTFPAFSRLQHAGKSLGAAVEKTLFGVSGAIFPITVGLLFFVQPLVQIIPRYGKWEPAIFSFNVFAVSSAIAALSTPLANALNAVGKIKITLWLMVMWTVSTWVLTVWFINLFGFNGVAMALGVITLTVILVVWLAKHVIEFYFWKSIKSALFSAGVQAVVYYIGIKSFANQGLAGLITLGGVGLFIYMLILWSLEKSRIYELRGIFGGKHETKN